jgi:hypothetical protein
MELISLREIEFQSPYVCAIVHTYEDCAVVRVCEGGDRLEKSSFGTTSLRVIFGNAPFEFNVLAFTATEMRYCRGSSTNKKLTATRRFRRVWRVLLRRRPGRCVDFRPHREEHNAPAHFLGKFSPAHFDGKPNPICRSFAGDISQCAVSL